MAIQINESQAFAYAELLEILSYMEKKYVEKIPNKLMDIFKKNASTEYVNHLDVNIPLEEQQLSEKTSALLAMLMINYWYESEEQKQELLNMYQENEKKYQEELREKYNPENIFSFSSNSSVILENNSQTITSNGESPINSSKLPVDYNSFSWYKKVFFKVKNFIYKLFKKENNLQN